MALALLVLAAGIGRRYGGLKQLDPVGPSGEVLLDYALYDGYRAGFRKVVFVVARGLETSFQARFGRALGKRMEVAFVCQDLDALPQGFMPPRDRGKPWGTAHAVWSARNVLREPFAVINADDFYGADAYRKMAEFLGSTEPRAPEVPEYAMVGFALRNTLSEHGPVARGVCVVDEHGYLRHIVELTRVVRRGVGAAGIEPDGTERALAGEEIVSMNFWGFTPSIFPLLDRELTRFLQRHAQDADAEFYLPSAIDRLIAGGEARVRVLPTSGVWLGMTYRADRAIVERGLRELVAAGEYPAQLWS